MPVNGGRADSAYGSSMLGRLQDRRGAPALRTRALAALVIVGMLVLTVPIVMIPLIDWAFHQI
jgi:hypothetical protein